jgi:hypothetical protein
MRHFTSQNENFDKNSEKRNTYVNGMTTKKIYLLTIEKKSNLEKIVFCTFDPILNNGKCVLN